MDLTPLDAIVRLIWLAGAVGFVIGLSQMNSPATARTGNLISFVAVAFATLNVVGGYVVTDRMLQMFRRRPATPKAEKAAGEP